MRDDVRGGCDPEVIPARDPEACERGCEVSDPDSVGLEGSLVGMEEIGNSGI